MLNPCPDGTLLMGVTEVMFSRVAAVRKFVVTGVQVTVPPCCVLTHCRKVVHSLLMEAGQTVKPRRSKCFVAVVS